MSNNFRDKLQIVPQDALSKNQNIIITLKELEADDKLKEVKIDYRHLHEVSSINVEVFIDAEDFNQKILRKTEILNKIVHGFLELFIVCPNALISLERLKENYGIKKIFVRDLDIGNVQGYVSKDTNVKISKIHSWSVHQYERLAGIDEVEMSLENTIQKLITSDKTIHGSKILLIGPSGSGKTTLIRNLALKSNLHLLEITAYDIIKPYPGDTESSIRDIFKKAEYLTNVFTDQNCIILLKDIEILCPKEVDQKDMANVSRVSSEIMRVFEKSYTNVLVIGTSSNIESIDLRLRRYGRIDEEIYIMVPDVNVRCKILHMLLANLIPNAFLNDIVNEIAFKTNGYVGADLSLVKKHILRASLKDDHQLDTYENWLTISLNALKKVQPSIIKGVFENHSIIDDKKTFDSIGGLESLKSTIKTAVLIPLRHPEVFQRFGLTAPRGILLYGPPGCAKTTIAQCIANETNMNFFATSAAQIYSPYVGKAEKFIVQLFNQARMCAPAIIFLDEIDALVGNRSKPGSTGDVQTRILSALLTEMDGIGSSQQLTAQTGTKQILVIAATNRPDLIDDALMRPGRFDKLIHVPAPNQLERLAILKNITKKIPFDSNVNLESISEKTDGFSGADLIHLCNEAALVTATEDFNAKTVLAIHFNKALNEIRPSLTKEQIERYKIYEKTVKIV